jgi:hypothetical protein
MVYIDTYSSWTGLRGTVIALTLNDSGDSASYVFTPDRNLTISGVYLAHNKGSTPIPNYLVGIQSNNVSNQPDGVWLISGALSTDATKKWNYLQFKNNSNLTSGTTYHLRTDVNLAVGSPTGTLNCGIWLPLVPTTDVIGSRLFENNNPITKLTVLLSTNSGQTWSTNNYLPLFAFLNSDNSVWGFPFAEPGLNTLTNRTISGLTLEGNYIKFQSSETISGIAAFIGKSVAAVDGSITYEIRIGSPWTSIDYQGLFATSGDIATSPTNYTIGSYFSPVTFSSGNEVIINFRSNATGGTFRAQIGSALPIDNDAFTNITGIGSVIKEARSTDNGVTWSISPFQDMGLVLINGAGALPPPTVTFLPFLQISKFWNPL